MSDEAKACLLLGVAVGFYLGTLFGLWVARGN
jgi:hypothetical protein